MTEIKVVCFYPAAKPCLMVIPMDRDDYIKTLVEKAHKGLKAEKHHVELDELVLYQAGIPNGSLEDRGDRALQWLHLQPDSAGLDPGSSLDTIFPDGNPPKGTLHFVVADPVVREMLDDLHDDPDAKREKALRKALKDHYAKMAKGPTPSKAVKNLEDMKLFLDGQDRLACVDGVPAALFSPPLAELQQRLGALATVDVSDDDVDRARRLYAASHVFHADESHRESAIEIPIDDLVGPGRWQDRLDWAGGIKPNASWWHQDFLTTVFEHKNMLGMGGDPSLQGVVDVSRVVSNKKYASFRGRSNFPVIILSCARNRFEILAAVSIDVIYASTLLTLDIPSGFHADRSIIQLARAFKVVSQYRGHLENYYTQVVASPHLALSSIYPNPTLKSNLLHTPVISRTGQPTANLSPPPLGHMTSLPQLTYTAVMDRTGQPMAELPPLWNMSTAMYIAKPEVGDRQDVVVKFTSSYSVQAHKLLADVGLAPKFHSCHLVVGDLYMVVMGHIKGAKSIWQLIQEKALTASIAELVLKKVDEALAILHAEKLIFGDLRDANVMYVEPSDDLPEGGVFIVDFDWAGKDGEVRYPASMNTALERHPTVKPYRLMEQVHDTWQLNHLKDEMDLFLSAAGSQREG